MKKKLDTHCSYMTTYRMYKDCKRELKFPLAVAVSYQAGDRGKSGEVVRGMWRAIWLIARRSGSNNSIGNAQRLRPAIAYSAKHGW